jgi:hypothetical protein
MGLCCDRLGGECARLGETGIQAGQKCFNLLRLQNSGLDQMNGRTLGNQRRVILNRALDLGRRRPPAGRALQFVHRVGAIHCHQYPVPARLAAVP